MQTYLLYLCAFCALLLAYKKILLKLTHMFQLSSYQSPSYSRYLSENAGYYFDARKLMCLLIVPCAMLLTPVTSAWVALIVGSIYVLTHPKLVVKKPLAYTPRIKRFLATSYIVYIIASICAIFSGGVPFGLALQSIMIFACPRLILLYDKITAPIEKRISNGYIEDARRILREMPSLKIIGITGSFGKTSTKYFLTELLSTRFNVFMTPGNYNTTLGVTRAVREGLRPTHDVFVCEMGARHKGDIAEICELVHPHIGVITSIGEQHLETFGSIDTVISTKMELYDAVRENGTAVLNYDNEYIRDCGCTGDVVTYGTVEGLSCYASDILVKHTGGSFTVHMAGESARFTTALLGRANIQNLLAAISVCVRLGIPLQSLVPAVSRLKSVPHRLELKSGGAYTIIDDAYNANPVGARNALETLACCEGIRILLTPGMVELGAREVELNFELGRQAASSCDVAVLVGESRTRPIYDGLVAGGFDAEKIRVCGKVTDGFDYILALPGGSERMVLILNDLPDNY